MTPDPEPTPAPRAAHAHRWILAAAILFGGLRFVRLGRWSLWLDEVFTWGDSHGEGISVLNGLGYPLVRWTVELFGGEPTEFALRFAPAVFGLLCVPLSYWAFRPLGGAYRAAWAALLVSISAFEIQWSQTARFYTMAQAVALMGAGIGIRGLLRSSTLVTVFGMAVAGLGVFFHLSAAILVAALGGAAFVFPPGDRPGAARAARLAFLTFAIPGLLALPRVLEDWESYQVKKSVDALGGVSHLALSTGALLTPALAGAALVGAVLCAVQRDRRGLFVAGVPILGGVTLALLATQAKVSAQYGFVLLPWIPLLAVWPVDAAAGRDGTAVVRPPGIVRWGWPMVLTLVLLAQTALYFTVQGGQRPRWREAVEFVAERRGETDVVMAAPASVVEFYLTGSRETDVRRHDSVALLEVFYPWAWRDYLSSGRPMWLILRSDYLVGWRSGDRDALERFLEVRCRHRAHFPVRAEGRNLDVDVWYFPAG